MIALRTSSRDLLFRLPGLAFLALLTAWLFISADALDMGIWLGWGSSVGEHGWRAGYRLNAHEHPPLLSLLFWLWAEAGSALGWRAGLGLKLSFLLCLFSTAWLMHRWSAGHTRFTLFVYVMLAITSLGLCYADLYFGLPLLLAFYFFYRQRIPVAVACFTLAVLIKYPPLIIAPFVAVYLFAHCRGRQRLTQVLLPIGLLTLPFLAMFGEDIVASLRRATGDHHGWLNAHGLNLMYLLSRFINPTVWIIPTHEAAALPWLAPVFYPKLWIFLFYVPTLLSFASHEKSLTRLLLCAIVGHLCYFMLNTCVHENHLLLSGFLAMALFCVDARHRPLALLLMTIAFLNLIIFFGFTGHSFYPLERVKWLLAVFNSLLFLFLWYRVTFLPTPQPE